MKRSIISLAASACLVALTAQPSYSALITFVSGGGSDASDCLTPATACRQLGGESGALSKTDPTGTIHVLQGEYDPFDVDKSVDIIAERGTASIANHTAVAVPGGGSASILVQGDSVFVRIQGFHIFNPTAGIVSLGAEVLHVEDCVITPGSGLFGIDFRGTNGTRALNVVDTIITGDGSEAGGGVTIKPSGSASAKVVLDNVKVQNNFTGITVDGRFTSGGITAVLRNSVVSGSSSFGVAVFDGTGAPSEITVEGSTLSGNGAQAVAVSGSNATARVRNSTVTANARGLDTGGGGKIISQGGNVVTGNTVNGAFTSTLAQQ